MKRSIFLPITIFIIMSATVFADTKVVQVNTVDAMKMMGQEMPARSDTATIWFSDKGIRFESTEGSSIIRNDLNIMYILMPDQKQYAEYSLSDIKSMKSIMEETASAEQTESLDSALNDIDFDKIYEEVGDSAKAEELMKMAEGMKDMFGKDASEPMISAEVTATDETRKIGDYNCRKYLVEMKMIMGMNLKQEIWASEDTPVNYQSLMTAMSSMMASMTGFSETMQEMDKIKGLPILTNGTLTMMGSEMKMTGKVISVKEGPAPDGTYDIPAGFTKVDLSRVSPH